MFDLVLIAGAILLVVILFMVFRIATLVGVVRGAEKQKVPSSNRVNAALMVLFMIGFFGSTLYYVNDNWNIINLPVASEHGVRTDSLFWITMAVTGFIFVLTNVLLFWFSWRYQYKEDRKALFYPDNNRLELMWTVVPAIVLSVLVFTGLREWNRITDTAPQNSEVIEIMGYQFAWSVRYPGNDGKLGPYDYRLIDVDNIFGMDFSTPEAEAADDFIPRELHLPKGKPVLLKIRARDVLHSVYLPHFRVKMDAVPGMPTSFWFTPTKSTAEMRQETGNPDFNYELACTEVCGRGHFSMRFLVVVDEPEDYEKWKAEQEPWLKKNPDYLTKIPQKYHDKLAIKSGISTD